MDSVIVEKYIDEGVQERQVLFKKQLTRKELYCFKNIHVRY